MNSIRKKLGKTTGILSWSDYKHIARELDMRHCNIDIMSIHKTQLISMIEDIPRFDSKGTKPDQYALDDIRFEWFFLRKGSEEYPVPYQRNADNRN